MPEKLLVSMSNALSLAEGAPSLMMALREEGEGKEGGKRATAAGQRRARERPADARDAPVVVRVVAARLPAVKERAGGAELALHVDGRLGEASGQMGGRTISR